MSESGERFFESPITGTLFPVTEWEELDDGHFRALSKTEVDIDEVPEEKLCDYCECHLAVEWSDQGKKQCRLCSPNLRDWTGNSDASGRGM